MMIKDKEVTIINDVMVEPTNMKIIEFESDEMLKKDGVCSTINGYNGTLVDILQDIYCILVDELEGTEAIADMEPGTPLCYENLYLDEELYDVESNIGAENPAIAVTEELIEDAKYSVEQYKYLIRMFDIMINGVYKVEAEERYQKGDD